MMHLLLLFTLLWKNGDSPEFILGPAGHMLVDLIDDIIMIWFEIGMVIPCTYHGYRFIFILRTVSPMC